MDVTRYEEELAHLRRTVDELSDVVARQEREIAVLARRVGLLLEREAEREAEGGTIPLADQKPPHWWKCCRCSNITRLLHGARGRTPEPQKWAGDSSGSAGVAVRTLSGS